MKIYSKYKVYKLLAVTAVFLIAVMAICSLFGARRTASAASWDPEPDPYKFEITQYDILYDISADCSMQVTEELTVHYLGSESTGFIRDIPVNSGAQVRNIKVVKLVGTETRNVYYDVYCEDISFVSVSIGDYYYKTGRSESYRITYEYIVPYYLLNGTTLPLNPASHGWQCEQTDVSVKLILPKGYTGAKCYIGLTGSEKGYEFDDSEKTSDGRTVITAHVNYFDYYEGLSFDLEFEKGVLSGKTDPVPYIFAGIGLLILAIVIALKVAVFKQPQLIPVTNFEAPNNMDPLLMGKLIDYKVDSGDITSLIYYFADKGYLKINLDDEDDPTLIRIVQNLPESSTQHERVMFQGLFRKGDVVKTSDLNYTFYKTAEKVTSLVNAQTKYMYSGSSVGASIFFAVLGGLLMVAAPIIINLTEISASFFSILPFIILIPSLIIYALSENIIYNALKYDIKKKAAFWAITALVCVITVLLYVFILATSSMDLIAPAVISAIGLAIIIAASFLIKRTEKYSEQLGEIVGFKNFIKLAEKDRLEKLLKSDPQYYYHILPYAQVLGVSDIWEKKFSDLAVQPPQWATSSVGNTWLVFHILNSCLHRSMARMSSSMVSRPSSSGSNGGGHFGGGFGGFSGGGFGGGGGRGR